MLQLPVMRDGAEEGFHQGRVAIRRTREVLALVLDGDAEDALAEIDEHLSRAFKALGKVRTDSLAFADAESFVRGYGRSSDDVLMLTDLATPVEGGGGEELPARTIRLVL